MKDRFHLKRKFHKLLKLCRLELTKTTQIGQKMLSASKVNSLLQNNYKEIGKLAVVALRNKKIEWKDPKVLEILKEVKALEGNLREIEGEVTEIKGKGT